MCRGCIMRRTLVLWLLPAICIGAFFLNRAALLPSTLESSASGTAFAKSAPPAQYPRGAVPNGHHESRLENRPEPKEEERADTEKDVVNVVAERARTKEEMISRVQEVAEPVQKAVNQDDTKVSTWVSKGRATSLSSKSAYPLVVKEALKDEAAFNRFKANSDYRAILEHIPPEYGQRYLDIERGMLQKQGSPTNWEELRSQNDIGSPKVHDFGNDVGTISPTMLRYSKVALDFEWLYGDLSGKRILEIGVGYGGLAHAVINRFPIKSYTFVDLPDVENLVTKVLQKALSPKLADKVTIHKFNSGGGVLAETEFDLCVSNYAYSEVLKEIADDYLAKVFPGCRAGYLAWNQVGILVNDYVGPIQRITGAEVRIEEEFPRNRNSNVFVLWGASDSRVESWLQENRRLDRTSIRATLPQGIRGYGRVQTSRNEG